MPKLLEMMKRVEHRLRTPELLGLRRRIIQEARTPRPEAQRYRPETTRDFRSSKFRIVRDAAALERLDDRFGPAAVPLGTRLVLLLRGLVKDGPDPVGAAAQLADVLKEKASLDLSLGQYAKAEAGYREAAKLVEPPASGTTPSPASLRVLAWNRVRLSYVLRETGKPQEALECRTRCGTKALQSLPVADSRRQA